jgi:hypothetical protein
MIMDTKLTLKLNSELIEKAKAYAAAHQRSLSRIIEAYLESLVNKEKRSDSDVIDISPFVMGLSTEKEIPHDLDYKNAYQKHLSQKHK